MDQILKTQWKLQAPACGWYISYLYRKSGTQISAALKDMNLPKGTLVMIVKRQDEYLIPNGSLKLHEGDKLLLISEKAKE